MRRLVLLVALFASLAVSVARAADDDSGALAAAATAAFTEAQATQGSEPRREAFRATALLFEGALDGGLRNGALEFNTANSWFLAGDTGRAILHYRRALVIRPGDPQVHANLSAARSRRVDQIEDTAGRAVLETVVFWHRGMSLRSKVPVALGAWVLAFGLLAVALLRDPGDRSRTLLIRGGVVLLLICAAVGMSAVVEEIDRGARDAAVVLAAEVELRKGDGASYPARYANPVHSGTELRVLEDRGAWLHVELPDGKTGWVPAPSVGRV